MLPEVQQLRQEPLVLEEPRTTPEVAEPPVAVVVDIMEEEVLPVPIAEQVRVAEVRPGRELLTIPISRQASETAMDKLQFRGMHPLLIAL